MKTLDTIQNELRELVTQGIDLTLAALKKDLKPGTDCHNDLILLEGRYHDVSRQLIQGTIANEDATLEFNKIRKDLLDFINGLKETDLPGLVAGGGEGGLPDVYNGEVLYRIPKKMQLGAESECIVRLAFDRKILTHDFEVQVGDVMKDLRISDVMGVELLDPSADKAFTITTLNDSVQFVEKDLVTEWIFCVTPLKEGEFPLVLKISIIEIINGIERKRNEVLKEQVQIVTEVAAEAEPSFVSAGYSWQVTNSQEQRAVAGGAKSVDSPGLPPSSPSPAAPSPAPVPRPSNTTKALGLAFFGKVVAGVAALVIGGVALRPFFVNDNSSTDPGLVDNSPSSAMKKLRSNPSREELEAFQRDNPGTPEAATAMMLLDSIENADWSSALASNDYDKMQEYLNQYPNGIHATEAARWMDEMNRTGEAVVLADSTIVNEITKDVTSGNKPSKPAQHKPKPAAPIKNKKPAPKPTPKPTKPTVEPAIKTDPVKPVPVDPDKPIHLISAARKPVFKRCDNSNKGKEEKCTNEKIFWFLKNRLDYPEAALQNSVEGTVVVSFVVERNGSITDVKALNDIGGDCAKEAVRLIKQLPKFKPGLNAKGDPIRVQYTQSIRFSLK